LFVCCRYENFLLSQECLALQTAPLLSALVLVSILQEGVVVLALRDILGGIALLGQLVVDQPELAALLPRGDAVEADVELGAVVGVGVLGVGVKLAELVRGGLLGTSEAAGGLVGIGLALGPVGDLRPVADSAVLVEPEAGGAGVLLGVPVHAGVEDVADAGVGVGVEAVETGTQVARSLGGLELEPIATVHVEVVVARLPLAAEGVKYETVGAESVLGLVVEAVVVFVTLDGVREVTVLFRTSEV